MRSANSRHDLAKLFAELGYTTGAEIGVRGGRYSEVLCQAIPNLRLYCIDSWGEFEEGRRGGLKAKHAKAYLEATERLTPYGATLVKKLSLIAAVDFPNASLDFVYLDAGHGFDTVLQDITAWSPKVRAGGIVSGHDYVPSNRSGVIEAVNAFSRSHHLTFGLTDPRADRGLISWYWVQPYYA